MSQEGRIRLDQVWEDLNTPPLPLYPLDHYQELVYDSIVRVMEQRSRYVEIEIMKLGHVPALISWLEREHNLVAGVEFVKRGCHAKTLYPCWIKCLVVKW